MTTNAQESTNEDLALLVELIPGGAEEGVQRVYMPGEYENFSVDQIVNNFLGKSDYTVEESRTIGQLKEQLNGGQILYGTKQAQGNLEKYCTVETTEAGESYKAMKLSILNSEQGGYL